MAIQYSGGTIINTTFTSDGTRRNLVDNLAAALASAGWSYISGSGTGDVLMQSATTPQGLYIRFRIFDPGTGNCAQITMKDVSGTLTSAIGYMLPTSGKQFRIVANKYQFFFFSTGSDNRSTAREIALGGTLWVPDFVFADLSPAFDLGWFGYTGVSDTTTTAINSFRLAPSMYYGSTIYKTQLVNHTNGIPLPGLVTLSGTGNASYPYRWQTDALPTFEALMTFSSTGATNGEQKIVGAIWDAIQVAGPFVGESTITLDDRTWLAITDSNALTLNAGKSTLFVVVP